MLYPGTGKPLFVQLKDVLKQKIILGELKEGERLPGERQLAETYGISRMTARQALSDLVQQGVLVKQQGSGYYVAAQAIENKLDRLQGVVEELWNQNLNFEVKVQRIEYVKAPPKVWEVLELGSDRDVLLLVRQMFLHGKPLSIDYTYLPMAIAGLVEGLDMRKQVLYKYLEQNGYRIMYAKQTISAGQLTEDEAAVLERTTGFPTLVIDRTAYLEGDRPIVYSHTLYISDRYHYTLTLKR